VATTLNSPLIANRYRLIRRLGRGGVGTVYQAIDIHLGRAVAIKALHEPLALDLLRSEARSLARLAHPNIVALYDLVETDGRAYLVMEFLDGWDLERLVAERGPLDHTRTLSIFRAVASAVEYAHGRGILHCDLKPANVLVTTTGDIKLTDFTLAHLGEEADFRGQPGGTTEFAAPEQLTGVSADQRTDVYGLGALLRRIVGPLSLDDAEDQLLAAVIERATAPDPDIRYTSVGDLLAALPGVDVGHTLMVPTSAVSALTRIHAVPGVHAPSARRRRPFLLMVAALPAVALAGAILLLLHFTASASPERVTLPSLVSIDGRSARLVAGSFDLRAKVARFYSSSVPAGIVAGQIPSPGTSLPHGATVTLYVSLGPRPIRVPGVSGLSESAGRARLQALGFAVVVHGREEVFDTPNTVLNQQPAANTSALPHSVVALTVSRKPWWEFWR
jgi:serine/threonine-protein kinase